MPRLPVIDAIEEAMRAQGKSKADFGRLLGIDSSQVTRTFSGKPPQRRIQLHEMQKVEAWLGWTHGAIGGGAAGLVVPLPGMVPLYGLVGASSVSRLTIAEQSILGYVPMHPAQANLREPFALQVVDESMIPRYEPGETVFVAPNKWPLPGQDAVLVDVESNGFLKKFLRRDAEAIHMAQLNPPQDLVFERAKTAALHAVVGRG